MSDPQTTELPWFIRWLDDMDECDVRIRNFAMAVRALMIAYIVLHIFGVLP